MQSLARAVEMSRSNFSSRFQSLVGTPPLRYLTQLRMNLTAHVLTGDARWSVGQVATHVGYDSESSFGRAFKRHFGASPRSFRRREEERKGEGQPAHMS